VASTESEQRLKLKQEIHRKILTHFEEKTASLESSIRELQLSANDETKSSAGDKYETGRAMVHLEIEKLAQQIRTITNARRFAASVNVSSIADMVRPGAIVETTIGDFFYLVNAGEFLIEGKKLTSISAESPLGKLLRNQSKGTELNLNGKQVRITEVF
jgi:transcription elongation GreA/GreB family factor